MKQVFMALTSLFVVGSMSSQAQAKTLVRVMAIGSSPNGQFVAFEEFGYHNGREVPFSKIRVMNIWKNKYVSDPVMVVGNQDESNLRLVRVEAKKMAGKELKQFNIAL